VAETGKSKSYISTWLRPALQLGLVDNESAGQKGKPAALKKGRFKIESADALPTVQSLADELRVHVTWRSTTDGTVQTVFNCSSPLKNGHRDQQDEESQGVTTPQGGSVFARGEGGGEKNIANDAGRENTSSHPPSAPKTLPTSDDVSPCSQGTSTPPEPFLGPQKQSNTVLTAAGNQPATPSRKRRGTI
jgi:hypothetical protein